MFIEEKKVTRFYDEETQELRFERTETIRRLTHMLTAKQWEKQGYTPKEGAQPLKTTYKNGRRETVAKYYAKSDVRKLTSAEVKERKEREREHRRKSAQARKEREQARKEAEERAALEQRKRTEWRTAYQWLTEGRVPKPDAHWERVGKKVPQPDGYDWPEVNYYYCGIEDTVPDVGEAAAILSADGVPQLEDTYTKGGWYDGRPWW